ncbi:UNVERIFIED_CONTAM: Nuclear cap-binding protein subunit [Sesamum radiatum]|uniref:Nuclear cap-binding protein subunit n=1 Tax=Sesamum radiatum TaxID=300843 RepID=A0AAW2KJS1_SESRA
MVGLPVTFRYEYLMAETIFSQILLLPQPPFKPIYYTLVIMDLCKVMKHLFGVLSSNCKVLFQALPGAFQQLWLGLSNFQFIWPWEEWAYVLDLPKWAPQRVFVQEVLEREVRLSYWDKIKQKSCFRYGTANFTYSAEDGDQTEHGLSAELNRMVKERVTSREIISWIEDHLLPAHGLDVTLRVVIQTLLNIGSKSFTHLITVLERYGQVIARICPDQDQQVMLISEILRNALTKTFNRITDLRKEILSLKKSVLLATEAASKAEADLEDAKSKLTLTLVDGEPVLAENPVKMKRLKSNAEKTKEEELSTKESLEAKEALLVRASDEIEALFLFLYKSFSSVLAEPLRDTDGSLHLPTEAAAADEWPSTMRKHKQRTWTTRMEVPRKVMPMGEGPKWYNVGEKEQWCLTTLGYVKAFTRQYASEIWPLVEKLDAEVLTEDVHPFY